MGKKRLLKSAFFLRKPFTLCVHANLALLCLTGFLKAAEAPLEHEAAHAAPYRVAIAPSHITSSPDPLFESDEGWARVAGNIDIYKYYGVQLMQGPEWEWATPLDPEAMVEFTSRRDIAIGCEFGDFHLRDGEALDASGMAFKQIDPVFRAGGEVSSLHLDGPVRRLLLGAETPGRGLPLDEVAGNLVDFWQSVRGRYPDMKIGLITNLPNWDYSRELAGYNGHYTEGSGVTYLEALEAVYQALEDAGEKIAFVEVDCPQNYYVERRTRCGGAGVDNARKFRELQRWCRQRDISFHVIVNAEPRGEGAAGFHKRTCQYVFSLRRDGVFPDLFVVQSWYEEPRAMLPETQKNTFMNTAKEVINIIQALF